MQLNRIIKRGFDIFGALIIISLIAFIVIIIYMMVIYNLGQPVFFNQIRPGLKGKPFSMVKFRTMTDDRNENGEVLPNAKRITPFGRFLRNSSLDELPELWNVLKGEMSLVGPRPLKVEYLELYNEHQMKRHNVRPGITGWAQINGRNTASWEQRFDMDVWYVENQSIWLDIKILFLTVYKVVKKEGVDHPVDEISGRFTGTKNDE